MKPLLVIDCYLDARGGARNVLPVLGQIPTRVVRPAHEPCDGLPDLADQSSAIYITGSAASVVDDAPPWVVPLLDLIRRAAARDMPVLGVCFGHQAIAGALLGERAVGPASEPEVGWFDIDVTVADPLFDGLGQRFRTFVSHLEEVADIEPAQAQVFARTRGCANHAFRVAGKPMWGVQFHAEMGRDEIRELVHAKAKARPDLGLDPPKILAETTDTRAIFQRMIDNFLAFV